MKYNPNLLKAIDSHVLFTALINNGRMGKVYDGNDNEDEDEDGRKCQGYVYIKWEYWSTM